MFRPDPKVISENEPSDETIAIICMEDLMEKLKLLNYENDFLKKLHLKPLNRYFYNYRESFKNTSPITLLHFNVISYNILLIILVFIILCISKLLINTIRVFNYFQTLLCHINKSRRAIFCI